jgi:hypothetical protein
MWTCNLQLVDAVFLLSTLVVFTGLLDLIYISCASHIYDSWDMSLACLPMLPCRGEIANTAILATVMPASADCGNTSGQWRLMAYSYYSLHSYYHPTFWPTTDFLHIHLFHYFYFFLFFDGVAHIFWKFIITIVKTNYYNFILIC